MQGLVNIQNVTRTVAMTQMILLIELAEHLKQNNLWANMTESVLPVKI